MSVNLMILRNGVHCCIFDAKWNNLADLHIDPSKLRKNMKKKYLLLALFALSGCKTDVAKKPEYNFSITSSQAADYGVLKATYRFDAPAFNGVTLTEAWSEYKWYDQDGQIKTDTSQLRFNLKFKFGANENFLTTKINCLNLSDYFTGGVFIDDVYANSFKKEIKRRDTLRLLLKIKSDTLPILFIKKSK